ncbi:hypothetical protein QKU48_gp0833 [Fadolivirus algeromassiliense]|jgi:hypothetical protein|uniref:Uncharacterized protein n=1 Tax=Fadolivirus FV1/VV64 TaxID=3070911 RepID=A0A7D3UUQ9_9VIRU|nr:hypothetical protein QKU48_gp0833 [Fadolivirus algeromassiliense]QKF94291.1 hypothetical protein Fadolivirus_1_833 [Fadolivirus FV1/VV64]
MLLVNVQPSSDQYRYNQNETNDKVLLKPIKHYLGIEFPPIPYLWHYDDFLQPFPVYGIKKISINKFKDFKINLEEINDLNDLNCDVYILAQYKREKVLYNESSDSNEVYLAYHTWLFNNLTKTTEIADKKVNFKFRLLTGIYPISGNFEHYKHYPFKNEKKKSAGGIGINNKLELRQATVHQHENHIKFSGINVCNFNITSENAVFVSVMKFPHIFINDKKQFIKTNKGKSNCIVLHVFRNVHDSDPNNEEYQKLVNEFFTK